MKATSIQREEFESRKNRISNPAGNFDKGGRWYPSEQERASCCSSVRAPSRTFPYSCLTHCRTLKHIVTRDAEREAASIEK